MRSIWRSSVAVSAAFSAAFAVAACDSGEKPAPGASPTASSLRPAAQRPRSSAAEGPKPPPESSARPDASAPDDSADPVLSFAGFSKDGKRFAYASGSASGAPMTFLWVTEPGATEAKVAMSVDLDYRGALGEAREFLEKEGFSGERRLPPPELKLKADLTATPPTLTIEIEGRKKTSQVGTAPHPETDKAAAWGLSPDGKYLAVRIVGPAVRGALSAGAPGRMVTFYRVVPMP